MKLQKLDSKKFAHRVKLMNELLGGMKVLKLYGWEPSFSDQILGIRSNEIKVMKKAAWLNAIISFIWTSVPFLVAVASFTTYVFLNGGQVLTPQKVDPSSTQRPPILGWKLLQTK